MKKSVCRNGPENPYSGIKGQQEEHWVRHHETAHRGIRRSHKCHHVWWTTISRYDLETKRQSMHWRIPTSSGIKKAPISKSKLKERLIVFFFDIKGLNGYLRLRRLIRNIIEKFLNKIEAKSWEGMFRFVKIRFMDSGLFPKVNSALKRVYLKFVKEVNEKMATFFKSVASNELQLLEDIKVCCNLGCINYIFNTRLVN